MSDKEIEVKSYNDWAALQLSDGTYDDWLKCIRELEGRT